MVIRWSVVTLGLMASLIATPATAERSADPVPAANSTGSLSQRIVWDAARSRGTDIRAANADGSEVVELFSRASGGVDNLTLSRNGELVAFALNRGKRRVQLFVDSTTDQTPAVNLLAGYRAVVRVGTLGWSPKGRRIAFEGFVDEHSAGTFYPSYLFTIKVDGTDLRKRGRLDAGQENGAAFGAMAWTRHGIVYPDDEEILLIRGNRRRVLARGARVVRPSGDGQWIYFSRSNRKGILSLWRMRSNGAGLSRVARSRTNDGFLMDSVPDLTGEHVLTYRLTRSGQELVTFPVTNPRQVSRLPIPGHVWIATWR